MSKKITTKGSSSALKTTGNSGTGRNKGGLGNTDPNPKVNQKSRAYSWTLNNYSEEEYEILKNGGTVGTPNKIIIGKEVGAENTPHLQGYIYYNSPISWKSFKAANPRMHFEVSKGSHQQNFAYCSKDRNYIQIGMDTEEHIELFGKPKPQRKKYSCIEEEMNYYIFPSVLKDNAADSAREWQLEKRSVDAEPFIDINLDDIEE